MRMKVIAMNKNIVLVLITVLASCSAFFDDGKRNAGSPALQPLAISGGGYLSTDNYNEITPFLYRDSGRAWLFFSSVRFGRESDLSLPNEYLGG